MPLLAHTRSIQRIICYTAAFSSAPTFGHQPPSPKLPPLQEVYTQHSPPGSYVSPLAPALLHSLLRSVALVTPCRRRHAISFHAAAAGLAPKKFMATQASGFFCFPFTVLFFVCVCDIACRRVPLFLGIARSIASRRARNYSERESFTSNSRSPSDSPVLNRVFVTFYQDDQVWAGGECVQVITGQVVFEL